MKFQTLETPADGLTGLKKFWKKDILSGFIISMIALPLCLGIALASGVPPMAGLIAGIVGGLFLSVFSGSYVTINGPAAGLAVIVLASVEGFRQMAPSGMDAAQTGLFAYQCTLGVGVACGLLQIVFGFVKAGVLSNFFPSSVVHGVLASIGIMIFAKQCHTALGVKPHSTDMLSVIMEIPQSIVNLNPEVALIALVSLVILIGLPMLKSKHLKFIPAPLLVIVIAIPMGHYFDLGHEHKYLFLNGQEYTIGPRYLVALPERILDGIIFPRFDYLFTAFGMQMVITYALVASLESLLTTAAVDRLDPFKRKSDFNRELFSKGAGNILSSSIGGLPIIAEVVRSSANIHNGAVTRWSNFFHGLFLLVFVVFLSQVIHQIPLAALAAMLMVIGYRLASPREFYKTLRIGKEQLIIFLSTILVTLTTDLLIGIFAGIFVKLIIHSYYGVPVSKLFKPFLTIQIDEDTNTWKVDVEHSAIFSNFMGLRKKLQEIPPGKHVIIDLDKATLVDNTVMEGLFELAEEYKAGGGSFVIRGLQGHKPFSSHRFASRRKQIT
jgi:MFS superfamily sulfate permease-like transporter